MPWIIAGSAIISGALGSRSADEAADASRDASRASIEEQRRQFDLIRADTAPYRGVGQNSLNKLAELMGVSTTLPGAPAYQPATALASGSQSGSLAALSPLAALAPGNAMSRAVERARAGATQSGVTQPNPRFEGLSGPEQEALSRRGEPYFLPNTATNTPVTNTPTVPNTTGVNDYGISMNPDLYTLSNTDVINPQNYAFDSSQFGVNPNNFGVNPNQFNVNPNDFGVNANQFNVNPDNYGVDAGQFSVDPTQFGVNPNQFSVDPTVGIDTSQYRVDPTSFDLSKDAGFQFRQEEGQRGLENMLSAQGRAMGGSALKEAMRFNQGFASNEFDNAYGRAVQAADRNLSMDFNVDRDRFEREFATTGRDYQFANEQDQLAFDRLINTTGRDYQMMSDQDKQAFDRAFASAAQNYSMLSEQDRQAFDRAFNTSGRNFQMAFDTDQASFDRAFQTDQTGYARAIGENQLGYERDTAANQTSYQRGLADLALRTDEYNRAYQRQQANLNRLMSLAGFGTSGVGQSASAGQNASSNISNILMQNAANQGSASMAGASAINNAIQGGLQNYYTSRLVNGTL